MNKIYYKGFKIIYTNEQYKEAEMLKKLIKADPKIMKELLPSKINLNYTSYNEKNRKYMDQEEVYIEDINHYIDIMLEKLYDSFKKNNLYPNDELFYNALLLKYDENNYYPKRFQSEEDLYLIAATKFYESKEEYKKYMINKSKRETNKIFEWMAEQSRNSIYNALLNDFAKDINNTDSNILQILEENKKDIDYINKQYYQNREIYRSEEPDLEKDISLEKLDLLFKKFLLYIDPTGDWMNEYIKLKKSNKIEFYEKKSNVDKSGIYYDKISLYRTSTLKDLINIEQLFINYIINKNETENIDLSKLPVIFYEELLYDFLIKEGYEKEKIKEIKNYQKKEMFEKYVNSIPIMKQIIIQKNNDNYINNFESIFNMNIEDTKECIDDYTIRIIMEHDKLIDDSLYIIGDLCNQIISKNKDIKYIENMKNITEQLGNITINDILKLENNSEKKKTIK